MKRSLATAFAFGAFCAFGLVGCGEESGSKTTEVVKDSGGTTEKTTETKVKSKGDNPPPVDGETGKTPK